jgi:acetoin utilization deacetylase AcuC-like enzyme
MRTRREFLKESSLGVCAMGLASLAEPAVEKGRTGFVYDDIYLTHVLERSEYEIPDRLRKILAEMKRQGLDSEVTSLARLSDPMPFIEELHTARHVASISRIPVTGRVAEAAVGGALAAVKAVSEGRVQNAFCAIRPPGHHANNTGEEEGFCYYSNVAIAAKYAQSLGYEKILIIDWDYHHGNGTQNAFYSDPTVLFFSTHDWQAYPGTGDPSLKGEGDGTGLNINVHLDCGSKDTDMLDAWDKALLPAAEKFEPDFILISAGFDSRKEDLLGCFDVTDDAFARMSRTTLDVARRHCEGRVVSLLEGGYNLEGLAKGVSAHVAALLGD